MSIQARKCLSKTCKNDRVEGNQQSQELRLPTPAVSSDVSPGERAVLTSCSAGTTPATATGGLVGIECGQPKQPPEVCSSIVITWDFHRGLFDLVIHF